MFILLVSRDLTSNIKATASNTLKALAVWEMTESIEMIMQRKKGRKYYI